MNSGREGEHDEIRLTLMSQYHPVEEAVCFGELSRPLTPAEFRQALKMGKDPGLNLIRSLRL